MTRLGLAIVVMTAWIAESGSTEARAQTPINSIPYTISQPGPYVVTQNLAASPGQGGIVITCGNVVLDLNGFHIKGSGGVGSGIEGPPIQGKKNLNIVIRNGSVSHWPDAGVRCTVPNGEYLDLRLASNATSGLVTGPSSIIQRCQAIYNGDGIVAGDHNTIRDCTVSSNTNWGFDLGSFCTATGCTAESNGSIGVNTGSNCTLSFCTATGNGDGFFLGGHSVLSHSAARLNGTGAFPDYGCTIVNCQFGENTFGIYALNSVSIESCTLSSNSIVGMFLHSSCMARNNSLLQNAIGINVYLSGNRIEGNHVDQGLGTGIDVDGTGNTIFRNTAGGQIPFDIAPGNDVGPIGTAATSSSPWANITL